MREAASFIASQSRFAPTAVLSTLVGNVFGALHAWNSRRQILRLADADEHILEDIGLTRADVRSALDLPFSYDPGLELQRLALGNRCRRWGV